MQHQLSSFEITPSRVVCGLASLLLAATTTAGTVIETDICIYGGAAGGVTAAVQARRMGKTVALVVFNNHLGGLSSGGLGDTDIGTNGDTYIQGIAREFYTRVGAKYGVGAKFQFEPKVAEAVFNEMAAEVGVDVHFNQRLAATAMEGGKIKQITMASGDVFRAKVFLDASYEGDLMKQAGVSYTAGREANSQYGETINGIQTATSGNQLPNGIDPYVTAGNPASGLLPGVRAAPSGSNGAADPLIQAYCYRLCLTNVAANRIMIPQPADYDEHDYEILFRAIAAGQTTGFWKLNAMPNGKTDSNNASGISCDWITGTTNSYVEADYATREMLAKGHEKWQRGLVWTVQNHPRVPLAIRTAWGQWGLPLDEFLDTGHWPHQLYVREARRMVSDYVMTEKNCRGTVVASDPIAMGAYTMDSHNCQRIVTNGMVKNEGDIQRSVPAPYPISYRSIVPKTGECQNLLVPWSLSATHIAFGSIRMEPVFMNVGQAAATAACFAIDDAVAVQQVAYPKLKAQLLVDQQKLTMSDTADSGVIVDNADASGFETAGTWIVSAGTAGYYGSDYLHDNNVRDGTCSARFTPDLPAATTYQVYLRWSSYSNRATNVPVEIRHLGGTDTKTVNQQNNGGQWYLLGTYACNAGSSPTQGSVTIRNTATNGYVVADAVRFDVSVPTVSLWTTDAQACEPPSPLSPDAQLTLTRSEPLDGPLTVQLAYSGTATAGTDYAKLPASVTFAAGESLKRIALTARADALAEGTETVTVHITTASAYYVDPLLNDATVVIQDPPFDAWRARKFSSLQLADPDISGPLADPDADGIVNLLEFFAGRDPWDADASPIMSLTVADSITLETFRHLDAASLWVGIERSADLKSWLPESGSSAIPVIQQDGVLQHLSFTLARTTSPLSTFFRLVVSESPSGN
jgi:hypothetical protein